MPRARARKAASAPEGPSKAWLDSYADAMTLLLAFFILLYASSILDEDLFVDFKIGVAQALGKPSPAIDGGVGVLDTGNGVTSLISASPVQADGAEGATPEQDRQEDRQREAELTRANAADVADELAGLIEDVGASPYVTVLDDPRGVVLRFDSQVLFRSGEAKILPDGVVILSAVSEVLVELDNPMVVEGHTDNVPTGGTAWPTNWELSTARATNVLRYLVEVEGIPGVRVSAAGYADTRPRSGNDTAEGRAENRRVEVIILVQQHLEELVDVADADGPPASDFGAGVEEPAAPSVLGDSLLDLDPEPAGSSGETDE